MENGLKYHILMIYHATVTDIQLCLLLPCSFSPDTHGKSTSAAEDFLNMSIAIKLTLILIFTNPQMMKSLIVQVEIQLMKKIIIQVEAGLLRAKFFRNCSENNFSGEILYPSYIVSNQ